MNELFELVNHTDDFLLAMVADNINKAYFVLFMIMLLETGLLIFPFLPGDGLLFSVGVVAAATELDIKLLLFLLSSAAIIGNLISYNIGRFLGAGLFRSGNYFLRKVFTNYIPKAETFYNKHGNLAIIIGRFFPILRTYVPFIAGVVKMERTAFLMNTIIGGIIWVASFLLAGFYLGEIEWVKQNYGLIFLLLIFVTLIPFLLAFLRTIIRRKTT
jgi:membrane-associated protein